MEFLILHIFFVFGPGFIWASIDRAEGLDKNASIHFFLVKVFMFGTVTFIFARFFRFLTEIAYIQSITIREMVNKYNFGFDRTDFESSFAVVLSLIFGCLWIPFVRRGIFNRMLRTINFVEKPVTEDVWKELHEDFLKKNVTTKILDTELKLTYYGIIQKNRIISGNRELLLKDAAVYGENSIELENLEYLHLIRPIEHLILGVSSDINTDEIDSNDIDESKINDK